MQIPTRHPRTPPRPGLDRPCLLALLALLALGTGCRDRGAGDGVEEERAAAAPLAPAEAAPDPDAAAPPAAAVTLGRVAPQPGATVHEHSELEMRVAVHHVVDDEAGPSFERHSLDRTTRELTVLEVDARGAITRARIHYSDRSQSRTQDGETTTWQSPVVGHDYLVDASAAADGEAALQVRYETAPAPPGAPGSGDDDGDDDPAAAPSGAEQPLDPTRPPPDELEEVRLDNRGLGQPDALREMLPTTTLRPGVAVALAHEPVARLFAQGSSRAEVELATLELRRTTPTPADDGTPRAILAAALTVRVSDGAAMSTRLVLTGELSVQLETGWVESMHLDGSVETAGTQVSDGTTLRMSGSGTVSMRYEARFARP